MKKSKPLGLLRVLVAVLIVGGLLFVSACSTSEADTEEPDEVELSDIQDKPATHVEKPKTEDKVESEKEKKAEDPKDALQSFTFLEDYRDSFVHGEKPAQFQKYIMLHDTEGESDPQSVVDWWDSNGNLVAAHFIVGKDGTIMQCVELDLITHHAGFGDTGHNAQYNVEDESRDDKRGTVAIGDWAKDYGMNSYSIGIEMVHVGGSGEYPKEQLEAVDAVIAYIDAYYGFESEIIDHKAWRTGNSDTSQEFSSYLENYKTYRKHTAE